MKAVNQSLSKNIQTLKKLEKKKTSSSHRNNKLKNLNNKSKLKKKKTEEKRKLRIFDYLNSSEQDAKKN